MSQVTSAPMLDGTGQEMVAKLESIRAIIGAKVTPATTAVAGIVKPDGETITVTADGTISAQGGTTIVQVPTVGTSTFTYNGSQQSIIFSDIDSENIILTGNSETNAGSYTCTCTLKSNKAVWSDLTAAPKTFNWTINKAQGSISLSPTSVTLNPNNLTSTITATIMGDGLTTIGSDTTSVATVSPSTLSATGTFTITATQATGSATITATLADGTNYLGASATCAVTCEFVPTKTFAAATDSEIRQMVEAADAGQIDLYTDCGWRVGQEHTTTLAAIAASGSYDGVSWTVGEAQSQQSITLVLMHQGGYSLVTPVKNKSGGNRSTCSFVVGLKDGLTTKGYMNSTNTNSGSWQNSARRGWCNGGFRQAMPADLRAVFKQFNCITGTWSNDQAAGGSNITTQDYFALFAGKEIFNGGSSTSYSTDNEANALFSITWYETTSNRIKQVNGSADIWWERSPLYYFSYYFCYVASNGGAYHNGASNTGGLAPFGCL